MPVYEFRCLNKKCGKDFDTIAKYDETGKYKGVKCPHCGSAKKEKLVSEMSFSFNQPEGTDMWRNSHDYRFKTKLPKAKAERAAATRVSKVGANPYKNIDDISSGKNFGEVK